MHDRQILYAGAFVRSVATSLIGVLLGIYLAKLHFAPAEVGLVIGVGLSGAALAALVVTVAGDRLGRCRTLIVLAVLGVLGALIAAFSSRIVVMTSAAFLGMLNGMGRDRSASSVLDQAMLPADSQDTCDALANGYTPRCQANAKPELQPERPDRPAGGG